MKNLVATTAHSHQVHGLPLGNDLGGKETMTESTSQVGHGDCTGRVKLHCFKRRQRTAPSRSHNCLTAAKALSSAAVHFDHGVDIAIRACADYDVILLSSAMVAPNLTGATSAHDGSDVVLWEGGPSLVDVERHIAHFASSQPHAICSPQE